LSSVDVLILNGIRGKGTRELDLQQLSSSVYSSTLHELFVCQARQNPEKIALVDGDVRLTYRELDELSNRLVNYLGRYQIEEGDGVGILLDKCYEYIVACVAILKTGGAYLHLELAYPDRFLQQIFADAKPKVVITKNAYLDKIEAPHIATLSVDADDWQSADPTAPEIPVCNSSVAIIGYSSGTTGKPKGVCVSHRATLYTYAKFWEEVQHIEETGRFAYTTFITWDALSPLVTGNAGYIVPDEISCDPRRWSDFVADHQVNHTILTPSLLASIVQNVDGETLHGKLQCLKVVWLGGEVTTQQLVNQTLAVMPHLYLINNYGPAECFVITQGQLRANDPATPSICSVGQVLDGMEVLILDEAMQPVPSGDTGELYATGPCLADGYLNNPELTGQKFIRINGATFYKTGDSARFLSDGRLVILGRCDATVKIRSYNVNLLAIEEILRQHPHISDCVVVAYGDEGDDKYLVVYLIPGEDAIWKIDTQTLNCLELARYLHEHLPFYMVPHIYVEMKSFPVHAISQKLDRASLPLPVYRKAQVVEKMDARIGRTSIAQQEQIVISLLEELLPQRNIRERDNFFEIGLHSLLAARIATRIREVFRTDLSVVQIYEHCTARELVAFLNNGTGPGHPHSGAQVDWQQESILDPSIVSAHRTAVFSPESQAVLLTGATGFLGVFLLAELLRVSPNLRVCCLVRSARRLPGLIEKMKRYHLWQEDFAERIELWIGDLEQAIFGWSPSTFEQYAQRVDAIFHIGAWVNMIFPYSKLKPANVDGTQEIIRFAACQVNKPLHHVSTLGILPSGNVAIFPENDQIDPYIDSLTSGYTQSKWVAEKLVWQAIDRGTPAYVYRPGNIGPDQKTFLADEKDSVMTFFDTCRQVRMAPRRDDWFVEYTPVDFVAKAIVQTALCKNPFSHAYHISSQSLIPTNNVFDEMQRQGNIDEIVDFDRWIDCLRDFATQEPDSGSALLEERLEIEEEYLLEQEIFDISLFAKQMQRCQLPLPTLDEQYLIQCITASFSS